MAEYMFRMPYEVADPTKTSYAKDALVVGHNDGVRCLWDATFPWSYPAGSAFGRPAAGPPADGALIRDVSEHSNAAFRKAVVQAPGYGGGGFRLDTLTGRHAYRSAPAGAGW